MGQFKKLELVQFQIVPKDKLTYIVQHIPLDRIRNSLQFQAKKITYIRLRPIRKVTGKESFGYTLFSYSISFPGSFLLLIDMFFILFIYDI